MTRSTLRRTSAAAMAVLALSSLAACGDDGDGEGDEPSSAESSSASTDDATEEPSESDGTGESGGDDESDEPEVEAGEDISPDEFVDIYLDAMDQATTASFEMDFGGSMAVTGKGVADFRQSPPAMKLTMTGVGTEENQEMIIVDGIMYLRLQDKSYMQYDLNDPNGLLGSGLTDQLDPAAMAEVFEKGITDSSYLGEEDVDGEPMEHYRVELDGAALLDDAKLPEGTPTDAVPEQVTFDIWFDDDGNFRRQEAQLGAAAGKVELSYDNWGEPVTIKAPPKSKITEFPSA